MIECCREIWGAIGTIVILLICFLWAIYDNQKQFRKELNELKGECLE